MATLWIAATTGMAFCSRVRITVSRFGSASALGVLNSRMSAPPENALPAPVSTMALIAGSYCARRTPSTMPVRRAWPRPLTGGLSMVMTAMSPCVAYCAWFMLCRSAPG